MAAIRQVSPLMPLAPTVRYGDQVMVESGAIIEMLLDHQVYVQRGALLVQWDVLESCVDVAEAEQAFDRYVRRLRELARDPRVVALLTWAI